MDFKAYYISRLIIANIQQLIKFAKSKELAHAVHIFSY